jgi:hypothetical protein
MAIFYINYFMIKKASKNINKSEKLILASKIIFLVSTLITLTFILFIEVRFM